MKHRSTVMHSLCCLLLALMACGTLRAQHPKDSVRAAWETTYAADGGVLGVHACSNNDLLVLTNVKDAVAVKRLRPDGRVVWDTAYTRFEGLNGHNTLVQEDSSGAFFIGLNTYSNTPYFCKLTAGGRLVFAKQLEPIKSGSQRLFMQSLFLRDSQVICYGIKGGYFWEARFRSNGEASSEALFEIEKANIVTDVLLNNKGEAVVVTKAGTFDKYGGGASKLNVQTINATARKLETVASLDGKNGRIIQLPTLAYALVFDASPTFPKQTISYALLDKDFTVRLNRPLFENKMGVSESFIQSYSRGVLAIATVRDRRNTVLLTDFDGNIRKEISLNSDRVMVLNRVFYTGTEVASFYDMVIRTDNTDPAKNIQKKLARFPVKS